MVTKFTTYNYISLLYTTHNKYKRTKLMIPTKIISLNKFSTFYIFTAL